MKQLLKKTGLLLLIITSTLLISCSKDDDNNPTNTPPAGNWAISMYFDTGDETSNFTGYTFSFAANGVVTATNGTNTVTGTWSQTGTKFIVSFGATPVFDDLNDDWLIVEKTSTSIKLKEDNPAQDDRLEFTRL